jgi:hypothetical protein
VGDRRLEQVAGQAAVAEPLASGERIEPGPDVGSRRVRDPVVPVLGDGLEDPDELVGGVVGELDGLGEPRPQTRVGIHEPVHLVRVAGHDHDHRVSAVLHRLDDGVDRLSAEVVLSAPHQGVRLVDEQDPALGLVEHSHDLGGRLADVACDQP